MDEKIEVTIGSDNVFADLGLPDADDMLVKAELVRKISEIIEVRGLTQSEAAKILGVDQPKVSALMKGKLAGFSMERLFKFLNSFDNDVKIQITPKSRHSARIEVSC
ncbi:MAG TPA: helix-turn-helix transcriptional regulator [Nostocaceae cyanobacterium]|nr:helix-turn-helix transcriptional regulator [Nostocaceae cyanobacterium]